MPAGDSEYSQRRRRMPSRLLWASCSARSDVDDLERARLARLRRRGSLRRSRRRRHVDRVAMPCRLAQDAFERNHRCARALRARVEYPNSCDRSPIGGADARAKRALASAAIRAAPACRVAPDSKDSRSAAAPLGVTCCVGGAFASVSAQANRERSPAVAELAARAAAVAGSIDREAMFGGDPRVRHGAIVVSAAPSLADSCAPSAHA